MVTPPRKDRVQNIASGMIPRIYGHSYAIEAELEVPVSGAEGVIVAEADEMGGFSLWVDEQGLLHHSHSMMGVEHYKQVSTEPIHTGQVTVRMQFDADREERMAGGTVSLLANNQKTAKVGSSILCSSGSRAMRAWTSTATTACPSTAPMPTARRNRSLAPSRRWSSTSRRARMPCTRRERSRRRTGSAPSDKQHEPRADAVLRMGRRRD